MGQLDTLSPALAENQQKVLEALAHTPVEDTAPDEPKVVPVKAAAKKPAAKKAAKK